MYKPILGHDEQEHIEALHSQVSVVDAHQDTLIPTFEKKQNIFDRDGEGHSDIKRLREGHINLPVYALNAIRGEKFSRTKTYSQLKSSLKLINFLHKQILKYFKIVSVSTNIREIEENRESKKISIILSIEGGEALEGDLDLLHIFYRLGVRCIGFTHTERNEIADSTNEERTGGGLTTFGAELVKEMNYLGVVIDLAHISKAGFRDVLDLSKDPVIVSHSNAHSLCKHSRNLTDEQIILLAQNGGVIGISFCPFFLRDTGRVCLDDVLDHIDYVVKLVGDDHVGIGSDYDGLPQGIAPPEGLENASKFTNLTRGLIHRGYSDNQVLKILGRNFLRIFRQVW